MPFDPANAIPVGSFDPARAEPVVQTDHGWAMPSVSGLANNFAAGTIEGATGALTSLSDPGAGNDEMSLARHLGLPDPSVPMGTPADAQHGINLGLEKLGFNPEDVATNTGMEQLFREGGRFLPAAVAGEGGLINRGLRLLGPSVGATVGHEEGGPIGEAVGGLAGGGLTALTEAGVNAGRSMAELSSMTPGDRALAILMRNLERGSTTPEHVDTALTGANGKPLTVMDVGGPGVSRLARTIATLPGKGSAELTNFLAERQANQNARIIGDIKNNLGDGSGLNELIDHLSAEQEANASPLYKGAFKANQNVASPEIDRILETPAGKAALASASTKMRNDRTLAGVPDAELRDQAYDTGQYTPGSGGIASGLKLRTLDYVKRALDDQIGAAQRAGANDNVRILTGLKNGLINEMDEADITARAGPNSTKPEGGLYAQARRAFAEPAQTKNAIEAGQNFTKVTDPDELAGIVRKLPDAMKPYFQIGAARKLTDMINGRRDVTNATETVHGNQTLRNQIEAVFGKGAAENFANQMTPERQMAATNRFVTGNSTTANKAADIVDIAGPAEKLVTNVAESGIRRGIGRSLDIPTRVSKFFNQLTPETTDELARLLMQRNGSGIINRSPLPLDATGREGFLESLINGGVGRLKAPIAAGAAQQQGPVVP